MKKLIFDIGGTYVKYIYINGKKKEVSSFPVFDNKGKENLPYLFINFIKKHKAEVIGVSAPAPFDYTTGTGYMKQKLTSLYHVSLNKIFKKVIPNVKTVYIHDAVAFMLGALQDYPNLKKKKVACVMLGTGLGYAFANNTRVWVNKEEVSMPELGFQKFRKGIVEDYASATALLTLARKQGYHFKNVNEMYKKAKKDPKVKKMFFEVGKILGEVLNKRKKIDKFTHIIIGGGVSNCWSLLKPGFNSVSDIKYSIIKDSTLCPLSGVEVAMSLGKNKIYLRR